MTHPRKKVKKPEPRITRGVRVHGWILTGAAVVCAFGFLIYQLYKIQITEGVYYRSLASAQQMKDWARMMDIEFVHIDKDTTIAALEQELFLADLAWKLK